MSSSVVMVARLGNPTGGLKSFVMPPNEGVSGRTPDDRCRERRSRPLNDSFLDPKNEPPRGSGRATDRTGFRGSLRRGFKAPESTSKAIE